MPLNSLYQLGSNDIEKAEGGGVKGYTIGGTLT
jgi:hypothetical protein